MNDLREILAIVYPIVILGAGMVGLFYVGLMWGWWK